MSATVIDGLREVDALEVQVLVDNVTDSLSTVPHDVTHEWGHLGAIGAPVVSGAALWCAAFGLSLVITARVGASTETWLSDARAGAYPVARNGERLKIGFGSVGANVLSHGQWDHAGGLLEVVQKVGSFNG